MQRDHLDADIEVLPARVSVLRDYRRSSTTLIAAGDQTCGQYWRCPDWQKRETYVLSVASSCKRASN
jgi:hypothetical protein